MHTVTIEILRPGESHDHALSEKTEYIALCGTHPPVTLNIACDQEKFRRYKQKLRYNNNDPNDRLEGIRFFEQLTLKIFDDIKLLLVEGQKGDWLHLRLVMTPKELAQLPFELALTPRGFQGEHTRHFLLNHQRLATLTREVRQVAAARYQWPYQPRILFAYAAPKNEVPHNEHLRELREIVKHFCQPYSQ